MKSIIPKTAKDLTLRIGLVTGSAKHNYNHVFCVAQSVRILIAFLNAQSQPVKLCKILHKILSVF